MLEEVMVLVCHPEQLTRGIHMPHILFLTIFICHGSWLKVFNMMGGLIMKENKMKKIIITIAALFSFAGSASFFQESCSNAEGTVKFTSGHVSNKVVLTEREYNSGKVTENEIELSLYDLKVEFGKEVIIDSTSSKNCSESGGGVAQWQSITAKKLTIKYSDGTPFSENVLGTSKDRRTVSAYVICDNSGNSMILCRD